MAKITLPEVANYTNITSVNSNFQEIADELNSKVLYRDNPSGEPNQMQNSLDMNSNRILNLPAPVSALEPVRKIDVVDTSDMAAETIAGAVEEALAAAAAATTAKNSSVDAANEAAGYAEAAYDNSRLTVGTVTTGAAGSNAAVTINGAPGSQIINFTIPRGDSGGSGAGGKLRIVVLGDSMTARQAGLDEVWPDALESTLRAAGQDVEIFNLAVNGATHYSAMTDMLYGGKSQVSMAIEYVPDIVIIALGLNDGYRAASVGTAQVITEAGNLYASLASAIPGVELVYASETFYDKVHGTPATLTNEQTFPIFANPRTTGILAGTYCPEIMPEASSAAHRNAVAAWVSLDTAIKGFGRPWFELPLWQACRLGLTQSDAFHINYGGHRFVAQAAFNWCRSYTSLFPNVGTQGLNSWNDWSTAFNAMLVSDGTRFVNKNITGSDAGFVCYWGPWNTAIRERWYSQSKASVTYDLYGSTYVKKENIWGFTVQGGLPGAEIFQSSNEGAWQSLGFLDSRGYFRYSIDFAGLGVPNGPYSNRIRVGADVFPIFNFTVTGTPYLSSTNIPLSSIAQSGAATGQVASWNGTAWVPTNSAGGAKAHFVAAGSTSSVTPVAGSYVPVRVAGSTSSHPGSVLTESGYWVGITAPATGVYTITMTLWTQGAGAGRIFGAVKTNDGVEYPMGYSQTPVSGDLSGSSFCLTISATAGQTIRPYLYTPPTSGQLISVPNEANYRWNTWSIIQIA